MTSLQSFITNYSWQIIDSIGRAIQVEKCSLLGNHQHLARKADTWTHVLDESILMTLF